MLPASLRAGITTAIWKVIKGFSLTLIGLPTVHQLKISRLEWLAYSWREFEWRGFNAWKWNLLWEFCSQVHWWLHFAFLGVLGITLARSLGKELRLRDWLHRFLLFAPWLMVLDLILLHATWILRPEIIPEPSTGFLVSIFRWELWHWDCWLDRAAHT